MNVKSIRIDPTGLPLSFNLEFKGAIIASYEYMLFEADSNKVLIRQGGNNKNPNDDRYELPIPVISNIKRLIDVRTNFVGLDPDNFPDYEIILDFFQGTTLMDSAIDSGKCTGQAQISQLFVIIE